MKTNSKRLRENAIIEAAASLIVERRLKEGKLRARDSENAPYYLDLHEIVLGEAFGRFGAKVGEPICPNAATWLDGVDLETGEPLVFVYRDPEGDEDDYSEECLLGIYVIKDGGTDGHSISLVPWKHEDSYMRGNREYGRTVLDMDDAELEEFAPGF